MAISDNENRFLFFYDGLGAQNSSSGPNINNSIVILYRKNGLTTPFFAPDFQITLCTL